MDIVSIFRRSTLLSMAFITTLLVGCGGDGSDSRIVTVSVSDEPGICAYGVMAPPMFCSPVAINVETGDVAAISGEIEGFTHEFGVAYVLRIQIDKIEEPMADGPWYDYKLLDTLSSEQIAQPGDIYTFEVPLTGLNFSVEDGNNFIGPYQFTCADGLNCQQLIDMDGSDGLVTIEFTYTGAEAPIELTFWN